MSTLADLQCEKNYSYQHIQGELLLNLNKIASENKLSHSEYRIMATIIGFYNKDLKKAYPSIRQLSKVCSMSHTTVLRGIKKLTSLGWIFIIKHASGRQNYFINLQKFCPQDNTNVTEKVTPLVTQCSNTYINKKEKKTDINKNTISFNNKNSASRLRHNKFTQTKSNNNRVNMLNHCKEIEKIDEPRLTRKEILKNLREEGKLKEATFLSRTWKIQ